MTFNLCPRPSQPYELIPFVDDYLESPRNAEIALQNRLIQDQYLESWIDAVLCYEKQHEMAQEIYSKEK